MPNIPYSKLALEPHQTGQRGAEQVLQFRRHVMTDAPSNRLTRTLKGMLAASIVTAGIAVLSPPASAQQSPAAAPTQGSAAPVSQPATTPGAASSGFQSEGIKATITSISLSGNKITIQFIIQNTRQSGVYVALISGLGGSSGTLMATNGSVYEMEFGHISGMSFCNDGTTGSTDQQVQTCLKGFDEHNMTMIEAGQSGILGIIYDLKGGNKTASQTDNVNFALKFLMRSAPGQGGTLAATAGGNAGPPSLVTISFPLIPLGS